ncbi:septal ring lytic transglycosylase RlpA family protein [Flavobacterium sp. DGU11]|uniref:Probable endolytic peptidoglycan transglycosylase RlpA n=1 Tax=Flavobacterium arundinis TaxID=3139143 RepID=A0ABU9HZ46_9FLAO
MAKKAVALFLFTLIAFGCSSSKGAFTSYDKKAVACYYADKFNGKKTANGDTFNNSKYTAAHRKLAFGTKVKVTNIANGKSVVVTVNDRGPFSAGKDIDLTKKAFMEITDNKNHGEIKVSIEIAK